jgi:hypothetical protein
MWVSLMHLSSHLQFRSVQDDLLLLVLSDKALTITMGFMYDLLRSPHGVADDHQPSTGRNLDESFHLMCVWPSELPAFRSG